MFFRPNPAIKRTLLFLLSMILAACVSTTPKKKETSVTTEEKPNIYFKGYIFRDNINVRQEASTNSRTIDRLKDGEEVSVLQNDNGWYEIITPKNQQGWVRSDFVGCASLSYRHQAAFLADSILPAYNTTLFIDENDPYAVIYVVLPTENYDSKLRAVREANKIGKLYQQYVFPGEVEIRILEQDKKTLYTRSILPKIGPVDLKAPLIKSGRLYNLLRDGNKITLQILVPGGLDKDELAKMATEISSQYGESISQVDIFLVKDSAAGEHYFKGPASAPSDSSVCLLHYTEDANGPQFSFNFCSGDSK